ncbi:hypothetical protein [Nocardia sp. NPDC050710]|uniref:LVIVD repeat-containing protein n=1 Tax=Nocardia sp. NPDC050710 TaxID=3157220 RepID=UPI0033CAE922
MLTAVAALAVSFTVVLPVPADAGVYNWAEIEQDAVPRAECGPGSLPETGIQGDVPTEDRASGRSTAGYRCNISRVGGLQQDGGGILSAVYDHCSYTGTFFPGNLMNAAAPGVHVIDAADPADPVHTTTLNEPAMLGGTWESLKVNTTRKLLAATAVPVTTGTAYFSIYDISDCAHPRLLNPGPGTDPAMPLPFLSHEGGFSPDGNTYWATSTSPGLITAIDVRDPSNPRVIWHGLQSITAHGFGISPDGNQMYLSIQNGINILDISSIQRRDLYPVVPQIATYHWADGFFNQHAVPVTYGGRPHIFVSDEAGSGGVKLIDVTDPARATRVATVKLEINTPARIGDHARSAAGTPFFSYDAHYCVADRPADPTALACSWLASGVRVFDVRDPADIREIAYFNPPAQTGRTFQLTNSVNSDAAFFGVPVWNFVPLARELFGGRLEPGAAIGPRTGMVFSSDQSADMCLSPPVFQGTQIWTTCSDNGFMVLQLENDVYTAPADQEPVLGS